MNKRSVAAVILASGMSRRMGRPKQLLPYQGTTLLEHVIRKLLPLPFTKIIAVVGHSRHDIMNAIIIEDSRFDWLINERAEVGQSAAMQCAAEISKDTDGMFVFLADQPLLQPDTIQRIYEYTVKELSTEIGSFVVQPSYADIPGHPVFFSRALLSLFGMLTGDEGGKRIIKLADYHHLLPVQDPGIHIDIDTPEDYQKWLQE
ncbi:nucleotidyltransferase family protein [Brevibacillus migulae]|uniref:nucleotidyltransferase family protein n=1 Tax=Brevibacillus migulae TaxID=1644114 RepID=UPI00106E2A5C|nr:nucleotidyltransferase family protein [Brevibacillus migulae]